MRQLAIKAINFLLIISFSVLVSCTPKEVPPNLIEPDFETITLIFENGDTITYNIIITR